MPNLSAGALCQTAALHRRFWLRVPVELIGMVSRPPSSVDAGNPSGVMGGNSTMGEAKVNALRSSACAGFAPGPRR